MIILNQLVEVATLDVFQVKSYITVFIAYLLASFALADVLRNGAAYAWPSVAFLYSCQDFCDTLMSHSVVGLEQDFVLIQLGHYNHAWAFVQRSLALGILYTQYLVGVN